MYYVKLNGRNHAHAFERRAEMSTTHPRSHPPHGQNR
jgi:hypothetical protein